MTENEERLLDSLEKKNKEMQEDFRSIADYAEALKNVTGWLLDGVQENLIVELTLHKIIDLAERNFKCSRSSAQRSGWSSFWHFSACAWRS